MAPAARTADSEVVTDLGVVTGLLADDAVHLPGCPAVTGAWPADRERENPLERYEAVRPASRNSPATTVTIVRCVECGGQAERTI